MTFEQYIHFRHVFVDQRLNAITLHQGTNRRAIELILECLCLIVTKRVPSDVTTIKLDTLAAKVKLISIPRDIEPEDRVVQRPDENGQLVDVKIEKNTKEAAVVRITIPVKKMTAEEIEDALHERKPSRKDGTSSSASIEHKKTPNDKKLSHAEKSTDKLPTAKEANMNTSKDSIMSHYSDAQRELEEKLVEVDQDERGLATLTSSKDLPYTVLICNQYAERCHRQEFLNFILKQVPEYFSDHPTRHKEYAERAELESEETIDVWCRENCGEYVLPCLVYPVNALEME